MITMLLFNSSLVEPGFRSPLRVEPSYYWGTNSVVDRGLFASTTSRVDCF
jgi:hypothetical protein